VVLVLLAAAFSSSIATSAQDVPLFHFIEKPGPRNVGLKVVEPYDYSRIYRPLTDDLGKPFQGERARPLQTLIWYPAEKGETRPMTVGDYANLAATETSFGKPQMGAADKQWIADRTLALATRLWAVRDAPMAPGRFPMVIYAPGFSGRPWQNADLCEYLASHGYVVIASQSAGERSREMTQDVAGINAQARDISFLIGYAQTLPDTDMSAIAVAGFSWGGISNLFAAARDNRIDALVGLDGSMRYYPGLVKQAGDVHPEQMTIPLLFFTQGETSLEEIARILANSTDHVGPWCCPNVLNAWTMGTSLRWRCWGSFTTSSVPCTCAMRMRGHIFLNTRRLITVPRMASPDTPGLHDTRLNFLMPTSSTTQGRWPTSNGSLPRTASRYI
jgi:dienelactone hydrolase